MNPNFPVDLNIHPSVSPIPITSDSNFDVSAQRDAISKFGIAGRIWEAAYAMISYINPPPHVQYDPPLLQFSHKPSVVLELGSGSGLVAFHLSKKLKPIDQLIVTDLPEVCPLLRVNLGSTASIAVRPLSWGKGDEASALANEFFHQQRQSSRPTCLTHVICTDLVYFPELLGPLLRSLIQLTSPPFVLPFVNSPDHDPPPVVYLSYMMRSLAKEAPFWSAFGLWFHFRPVLTRIQNVNDEWVRFGAEFPDPTYLFVAERRHESYSWKIPDSDADLLAGVGARGTDVRKWDDTLEELLFMSLQQD